MSDEAMSLDDARPAPDAIPRGWYTDPYASADVRWWTGQEWTHHVQPRPVSTELVDTRS
jgi:hypothetical protein